MNLVCGPQVKSSTSPFVIHNSRLLVNHYHLGQQSNDFGLDIVQEQLSPRRKPLGGLPKHLRVLGTSGFGGSVHLFVSVRLWQRARYPRLTVSKRLKARWRLFVNEPLLAFSKKWNLPSCSLICFFNSSLPSACSSLMVSRYVLVTTPMEAPLSVRNGRPRAISDQSLRSRLTSPSRSMPTRIPSIRLLSVDRVALTIHAKDSSCRSSGPE